MECPAQPLGLSRLNKILDTYADAAPYLKPAMGKPKSKGWRRRWIAVKILGLDIEQLIISQGDRMEKTVHEEVQDIKDAVAGYQQAVTAYDQTVTEEMD